MKYNCLIVDDEHLARTLLESYVRKIPVLNLIGKCKNPLEAIPLMQENEIDILFLDIQMPEITGLDFLKTISDPPVVILTTAYQEYALESYQLDVTDYLLKPFSFERVLKAVDKASKLLTLKKGSKIITGAEQVNINSEKEFLNIKVDHKIRRIPLSEIIYIEGMKEYVAIHTPTEKYITLESLKNLEETLPESQFIRSHKSFIVSIKNITALDGNQIYIKKTPLPVGKNYKEDLIKKVFS